MALVKLKDKGQLTLPAEIRRALDLDPGDILEAEMLEGRIVLSPKAVVDRDLLVAIRKGLDAYAADDVTPTFDSVEELDEHLERS